ncbi:hypothetical protein HHK36_013030 [Tetracentron sinense]|uniref:CAND6/7 N-terminal domain-containing protein n=1 Tax=Tetracentron sinense TaxID=13715 RepID=A0A835DF20_TETSI|nr:hypothetical protein HHK36_013030 [Tetracentron sinense]
MSDPITISYRPPSLISRLIFFALSFSISFAEIRSSNIRSDDRRIIPLDEFGFTHTGHLELNVSQISLSNRRPDPDLDLDLDLSQVGFILSSRDSWIHVLEQIQDWEITCPLQSNLVKLVYTFDRLKGATNFDTLFTETDPNQFMLVFANCLGRLQVSMDVRSAMYNLDAKSGRRDYLSTGKTVLPRVYFIFFWIYFSVGLLLMCILTTESTAQGNHFLMLAAVVLKALILLCEAEAKSYIMHTGSSGRVWGFLFYLFSFSKGITLINTLPSWFLKSFDDELIRFVIPLQIVAIVGQVLIDEIAQDWITWKMVLLLVDLVCSCAVFSIVWSWPSSSMWSLDRKKEELFRRYYIFIICNIYSTRVVVYALNIITSYRYLWTSVVIGELSALACYAFTGFMFLDSFQPDISTVVFPTYVSTYEPSTSTIIIDRRQYDSFQPDASAVVFPVSASTYEPDTCVLV